MFAKLLHVLHRHPLWSTAVLLAAGMAVVFANMVFLADQTSRQLAEAFAATYVRSLDGFQAAYSSKVVAKVKEAGIEVTHDYHGRPRAIPLPATFSIELAQSLTDPDSGIITRVFSDYPFRMRIDGGTHDAFERDALAALRANSDPDQPFIRYETVAGRKSLRYAKAIVMQDTCVACHNSHAESPKKDWQVGDVRGVRAVVFPITVADEVRRGGWLVTAAVMLSITLVGVGLVFLIVQALRASIDMLSTTNSAYNRFVPHAFLGYLRKQSIVDVQLNDNVEQEMTVLFSDIRSFTDMSERMTPEQNFRFVNEYLSLMGPVVRRNRGFIDKYIGDAIMALFDHPDDAVVASMEMLDCLKEYNADRRHDGEDPIRIGIGIHTGTLRLGTIGEEGRMDGTVIGDSVNLAARLEGLTKFYRVQCLISGATRALLDSPDNFTIRRMDRVRVKGKREPVDIFEVMGAGETRIRDVKREERSRFELGIELFQSREFEAARRVFAAVAAEVPEDRAAALYVKRCADYVAQPPPPDWDGTLRLDSK